ncbi:TPA: DNA cytosine methyltransferase [Pseudomonas aeruginosa]|uniref:DNA cytosine methyltransferase n=1 Tax=Pseudomonas aeruginosa TaxID=287 RepID=UPI00115ED611|nr:DNA cytosine methyltransferase [Pseudomonas aeruginosa]KAB5413541.1 DNA cytosine methyltransferase [Pseudomonas aeruginosa]TRM10042.1 DNA cytosine methyltransferase [Pseudomonas aeruginosa]HEJ2170553.1 DNA cytosine methyltransferase [Pseudomonas aeruginosa]HEK1445040.1 DNA cytosine methyltransferase [Pseudomonas aeruginosa]
MSGAYYNEFDPYAAQWLRNLIAAGHIAPGDVDERSIEDVQPDDLKHYTQCHFFAGIGVWSLALRRAGWPDDRPVWTGSCPCQPFSSAGEGAGFDDPRHLWPHFAWLIRQRRPGEVLGEQVASKDAEPWLDLVQADLEDMEYAFGAIAFPSAGIGAPHIRDRTYWVANTYGDGCKPRRQGCKTMGRGAPIGPDRGPGGMGDASGQGLGERVSLGRVSCRETGTETGEATQRTGIYLVGMANADGGHSSPEREQHGRQLGLHPEDRGDLRPNHRGARDETSGKLERAGPVNGLWADADWIFCRDGKWRPVEPGTFPLAHGAPSRVGRLRAYGNAINAEAATQFIAAYLDATS